jgi:hypothetical protein
MKILIAIKSAHSEAERRTAQRGTWLQNVTVADYKFFLGFPESDEEDVITLPVTDGPLWDSPRKYHRTLVLVRKVEALIEYALELDYDYAFVCDDDAYVRPDLLLASGFEQHDYSGFTERHYALECGEYRWVTGGSGYWLSRCAMNVIHAAGLHCARVDDIAIGETLAKHGIRAHHDHRYITQIDPKTLDTVSADSNWITLHKINPAQMRELHARVGKRILSPTDSLVQESDLDEPLDF